MRAPASSNTAMMPSAAARSWSCFVAGATINSTEDASNATIDLFAAFADDETADSALSYSIVQNSNPSLFDSTLFNTSLGTLTLDYALNAVGSADLTLRATDAGGLFADATFTVTLSEVNDAPQRSAGSVVNLVVAEGAPLTSLGLGSLSYGPGGGVDEASQTLVYEVTAVPAASLGEIVLADNTSVVNPGIYLLADIQGMQFRSASESSGGPAAFSFTVTDNGTTNGASDPLSISESLDLTVTETNDAPIRTAGTVAPLVVIEDAATTSLGLAGIAFGPGGGVDEATQTLSYAVTAVPSSLLGNIVLANGTTPVSPGTYSLAEIRGMQFLPAANAHGGPATFAFSVTDDGTTAGASDPQTLEESLDILITEVNDSPVLSVGSVANLSVEEDVAATSLGLETLVYSPGANESSQSLVYEVTAVPSASLGHVVLADGSTVVGLTSYSISQIQGMQFRPAADAIGGPEPFSFTVTDNGTTNGTSDPLFISQTLTVSVTEVNDQPERTAGAVDDLAVVEDSGITPLGLSLIDYSTGGGADEAAQSLTYTVTGLPSSTLGDVVLANGTTAVILGPYSLADLRGMQFRTAPGTFGGPTQFSFSVTDNGTTNGASDPQTLVQSLDITVAEFSDPPTTSGIADVNVIEDAADFVINLFAAFDDPEDADTELTYTIEDNSNSAIFSAAQVNGLAGTLTLDFAPDAEGTSIIKVRATDTGGLFVETTFTVSVSEVNDTPERTAGIVSDLVVLQNAPTTTLNLGALDYAVGGGSDETIQSLSYSVTTIPPAAFGEILLSDGTTPVALGTYSLLDIRGMQFRPAAGVIGGPEEFRFSITDNGTTNGAADPQAITESLSLWINSPAIPASFETRISAGDDDVEQRPNGRLRFSSADLELSEDGDENQTVGLRFLNVAIPQGATITSAYVQFQVDETDSAPVSLTIVGEDSNNSSPFSNANNLTSRSQTSASAAWNPAAWNTVGEQGPNQRTPDLTNVIQEIVARGGWSSGNALSIFLFGNGTRTAESYNGDQNGAPLLHVDYTTNAGPNTPPTTSGIAAVNAAEDAFDVIINLFAAFDDTETADSALSFTIQSNTNAGLFTQTPINGATGALTLDFAAQASGTAELVVRATDAGGLFVESLLSVTVSEVNDSPVRTAGTVNDLSILVNAGTVGLGLGSVAYGPGGGSDENTQTLAFAVTAVPNAALGDIVLADGSTTVSPGPYSLADIRGMQFRAVPSATGGPEAFSYTVTDNGTTAGAAAPQVLSETINIEISAGVPQTIDVRINDNLNDAEQRPNGGMRLNSSDLELTEDDDENQTVGMRFTGVSIPQGATITNAYIQFQVDQTSSVPTSLTLVADDSDNSAAFTTQANNLTSRPQTSASASWNPAPWTTKGAAGVAQRTSDLANIVQEVVDRPGWTSGNALSVLVFGSGERTAEAHNGDSAGAPLLHVEFIAPSPLHATSLGENPDAARLTDAQLQPIVQQAIERLSDSAPIVAEQLRSVSFEIADLAGTLLGTYQADTITIDADAAGWGWFVDTTPGSDEEFIASPAANGLRARQGTPAEQRIDLLSAVMHELGHALGLEHDIDAMAAELETGIRRDIHGQDEYFSADEVLSRWGDDA